VDYWWLWKEPVPLKRADFILADVQVMSFQQFVSGCGSAKIIKIDSDLQELLAEVYCRFFMIPMYIF